MPQYRSVDAERNLASTKGTIETYQYQRVSEKTIEKFLVVKSNPILTFLFPFLFALAFTINVLFWNNAFMSSGTSQHVGNILLASLMTLGVLEHILMVVPFNCNGIWSFGLTVQK